eukprot:1796132-Rhodomonas_salina.1
MPDMAEGVRRPVHTELSSDLGLPDCDSNKPDVSTEHGISDATAHSTFQTADPDSASRRQHAI